MKQNKQTDNLFCQAVAFALRELKVKDPIAFMELISPPENITFNKIKWIKEEKSLLLFFNLLRKHRLISSEYDCFKVHFIGTSSVVNKITWKSNINELVYLFNCLAMEKITEKVRNPHSQICEHFIDQYGQPLKSETLRTLLNKGINDAERESIIENIIKELVKG